ncbi:MAG: helix-turn-helix domain-containing protein [SAR324 cluster bacterium]|nr:helix-turn-helix domain-containing protein [SAR324 cluster bacterium]
MAKLNEMIREFRESINQSVEALAMLLQLSPEEYIRLEGNWNPPDPVLERICTLFEWNYQEIKRIALQGPFTGNEDPNEPVQEEPEQISSASLPFPQRLAQSRMDAGQTPEGMAMLLGVSEDYYLLLEENTQPDDDLLRRICGLFNWNYNEVLQKLRTRHHPLFSTSRPTFSYDEIRRDEISGEIPELPEIQPSQPLNERIRQAREEVSQSIEGLALLLQLNPEYYEQIESGKINPDEDLLKRISALFQWNFQDLIKEERRSSFKNFHIPQNLLKSRSLNDASREMKQVVRNISEDWGQLNLEQQRLLLNQLELIRDTMKRWKKNVPGKNTEPTIES